MSEDIGYQDGIGAFGDWLTAMDKWQEAFHKWTALPNNTRATTRPPSPPPIQSRGPNYDPNDMSTWPWPDKLTENTLRKLKDTHDVIAGGLPPVPDIPPGPTPPPVSQPWDSGFAPQSYNKGSRGQNAKFNIRINCTQRPDGKYGDRHNIVYSDSGLCDSGGRTENDVDGLKPSDMTDGREPWEAYEWMGKTIGPNKENYPAQSYER